jgi:hypothetical protein
MVLRNASFFESRGVAQWFGKARASLIHRSIYLPLPGWCALSGGLHQQV